MLSHRKRGTITVLFSLGSVCHDGVGKCQCGEAECGGGFVQVGGRQFVLSLSCCDVSLGLKQKTNEYGNIQSSQEKKHKLINSVM